MQLYGALQDQLLAVEYENGVRTATHVESGLTGRSIECVDATPARPKRVYAGTVGSGLFRSTNAGQTWEEIGAFDDRITAVSVSPHDSDVIWLGTEPSAVYRSTDGGDSWESREGLADLPSAERWSFPPRPHTHHVRWIEVDPRDPDCLFVGIEAGAFVRSTDGGVTWEDHPEGARRDNHTLATHSDAPGRVYAAAGDGYAESTDAGVTWERHQSGLEHRYVWGLAVDSGDPDRIVVSAASGARSAHTPDRAYAPLYRRQGDSWERIEEGLPDPEGTVRSVLDAGPTAGQFVALNNRGLYYSGDGASTWQRLPVEWEDDQQVPRGLAVVQ